MLKQILAISAASLSTCNLTAMQDFKFPVCVTLGMTGVGASLYFARNAANAHAKAQKYAASPSTATQNSQQSSTVYENIRNNYLKKSAFTFVVGAGSFGFATYLWCKK